MVTVNIMGNIWTIEEKAVCDDELLETADGYTDPSTKCIVIRKISKDLKNWDAWRKEVIRHELIHAFLFESGLGPNWEHSILMGHDETTIDWIAIQWPKIQCVFKQLNVDK